MVSVSRREDRHCGPLAMDKDMCTQDLRSACFGWPAAVIWLLAESVLERPDNDAVLIIEFITRRSEYEMDIWNEYTEWKDEWCNFAHIDSDSQRGSSSALPAGEIDSRSRSAIFGLIFLGPVRNHSYSGR